MDNKNENKVINILTQEDLDKLLFGDLPIGLIILDSEYSVIKANKAMFEYFKKNWEESDYRQFGNMFNCKFAEDGDFICGTGKQCKYCDIRSGMPSVLENGFQLKEVEISHDFLMNGRNSTKWFTINANRLENAGRRYILATFTDITKRKNLESELIKLGITDELTGLFNRRYIIEKLKNKIYEVKKGKSERFCTCIIDIDDFKKINDTYGHLFGDKVLISLADCFRRITRYNDVSGRYGGEEFLLILETDLNSAKKIVQRILKSFGTVLKDEVEQKFTFSAGLIEVISEEAMAHDMNYFIEKADKLLYKAKYEGKNKINT